MSDRPAVTGLNQEEVQTRLRPLGARPWHAGAILRWIHRRRARSFEEMSDLPRALREKLSGAFLPSATRCLDRHPSSDGTVKLLLQLADGDVIETVLIPEQVRTKAGAMRERRTVCVSTQVGCPMACTFCASGLDGLKRNLSAGEIVEQVLHVLRELPEGERIGNVVIMGIGEPLLNYDALLRALRIWKAPWGGGIGYNRVTLSTVGVLGRLKDLVRDKVTPNLALSLHAPNDAVRSQIVPTMKNVRVDEIVRAGAEYKRVTRKNVTFEYVLLEGVNDAPEHARELGQRVRGTGCKVNVIPFNRVEELPFRAPSKERLDRFVAALGGCGVPVTVRKRKGDEVSAACGQLRARWKEKRSQATGHRPPEERSQSTGHRPQKEER